jgi:hypothetical protein
LNEKKVLRDEKKSELAATRSGKTKINNPAARKQPFAD